MGSQSRAVIAAQDLLHDLEATAPVIQGRVAAVARDHAWLLERIHTVDVIADEEFQRQLCRHVGMRGKLRMRRERLFEILTEFRARPLRTYPDLLMQISKLTGQVEKAVASEILALLEPDQPTIDREVKDLLPRYGFWSLAESPVFDECVSYHRALRIAMMQVVERPEFHRLELSLDRVIGSASVSLSRLRKLNLLLSGSYRTIALLPTRARLDLSLPAVVVRSLPVLPAAPCARPGVRLHLCR